MEASDESIMSCIYRAYMAESNARIPRNVPEIGGLLEKLMAQILVSQDVLKF